MKKVYNRSGKFLGMVKKTQIYIGSSIIYEDAERIYID